MHMRLGDFATAYPKWYHNASLVRQSVARVVDTSGLKAVFLATNGSPDEVGVIQPLSFGGGVHINALERSKNWSKRNTCYNYCYSVTSLGQQ